MKHPHKRRPKASSYMTINPRAAALRTEPLVIPPKPESAGSWWTLHQDNREKWSAMAAARGRELVELRSGMRPDPVRRGGEGRLASDTRRRPVRGPL